MKRILFALALLPVLALGMWVPPKEVPVDRLLKNTEEALKKRPDDAALHYFAGRLHSLIFAVNVKTVDIYGDGDSQYSFPIYVALQRKREKQGAQLNDVDLGHLRTSIQEYKRAVELNPKDPLAPLGLGWMHEEAAPYAKQLGSTPATLRSTAAGIYRKLYRGHKANELKGGGGFGYPDETPAKEAGKSLLRLFKMGVKPNRGEIAEIQKAVKVIESRSGGMITPIVFPVGDSQDLFRPDARSPFDVAGDGSKSRWSWVSQNAAFLAWDPKGTGQIKSGQQLFGSRTFWMFFQNGYDALASLDDNQDGWLSGKELQGIVVWHDRNENGVSDRGEVVSVGQWGISSIRVRASGYSNGMPFAESGLVMADGRKIRTIDWVAEQRR